MRVLIVHNIAFFAAAVAAQIAGDHEVQYCTDGEDAIDLLEGFCPEVLVVHTSLPRRDWLSIVEQSRHRPGIILVTSLHYDDRLVEQCVKVGVRDLLMMPTVAAIAKSLRDAEDDMPTLFHGIPVSRVLSELGMPAVAAAYPLICQAAEMLMRDPELSLSREIYPRLQDSPVAAEKGHPGCCPPDVALGQPAGLGKIFPRDPAVSGE